ncbi:Rv3235 family protein [Naumannella halotolerans]|uniref:Rv3235 family protein n=1 Tax=Naumannella halotolerans TaxID=993414 RepID=UPI00370D2447
MAVSPTSTDPDLRPSGRREPAPLVRPAPAYLPAGTSWRAERTLPSVRRHSPPPQPSMPAAAPRPAEGPAQALARSLLEVATGRRSDEQLQQVLHPAAEAGMTALRRRFTGRPVALRRALTQSPRPAVVEVTVVCTVGGRGTPTRTEAVAVELRRIGGNWRVCAVECAGGRAGAPVPAPTRIVEAGRRAAVA